MGDGIILESDDVILELEKGKMTHQNTTAPQSALLALGQYRPTNQENEIFETLKREGYDLTELQPAVEQDGNKLVITCAGSGKTTMLCINILNDLKNGAYQTQTTTKNGIPITQKTKVWVGTFSASGAKSLKNSLNNYADMLDINNSRDNITISTLHAEFKKVIEEAGDQLLGREGTSLNMIDDQTNEKILKKVLTKKHEIHLQQEDFKKLYTALMYTRASLKADKKYSHEGYKALKDKENTETIEAILDNWAYAREHWNDVGGYDFEDLQDILYVRLAYPDSFPEYDWQEAVSSRYTHIFMDEFQDTSDKQLYILKHYATGSGFKKIVAVGDDDQMIYSWRGSSTTVITKDFKEHFNPTVVKLSKNRRCARGVLMPVIPSIERNTDRYEKLITSDIEGGRTELAGYSSFDTMGQDLIRRAQADVRVGRSVAVLCRDNRSGIIPALFFQFAISSKGTGVNFRISGFGMSLASRTGKDAVSVLSLIDQTGDELYRPLSNLVGGYMRSPEVGAVVDRCRETGQTVWELMDSEPEGFKYTALKLYGKLLPLREAKEKCASDTDFALVICDYFMHDIWGSATSDKQLQLQALCQALKSLIAASGSYREAVKTLYGLGSDIRERVDNLSAPISVATVHDFKGKEADSVYLWDDTLGVFPKDDALELEEERRLHYIACTRARDNLVIMYRDSEGFGPGRFVREMDLSLMERRDRDVSGLMLF